jgi:predicted O-linked N-acetylglucosamine transferase (SPINDLY family)
VVTFGCFNNANKLNDATLDLWARVLAAVPGSRLLLKWRSMTDPVLSSRLRDAMASRGLPPERLLLEGEQPHPEMLARYGQLDIALDPMPFSGALTSFEALWMGVPVVTLPGRRAVSRQTHAILSRISAQDWSGRALSAGSEDEFVAIAAALAEDIAKRRRLRTGLRAMLRDSPMFDPVGFVTELERVYRELWREYCARAPAGS